MSEEKTVVDPAFSGRFQAAKVDVFDQCAFSLNHLADIVHADAVANGWWSGLRNDGELIALTHSELSEALEGLRRGNPPSEHIPEFSAAEEEMADVIIRVLDHCSARNWDIGNAVRAKLRFNRTRGFRHGGKEF